MGDWRDWWLNSQAANDLSNLFDTIPNRLKRILAPENTTGQQIQYPTNHINYDKLIKPEEVTQKDFLSGQISPKGRQKDVYIGSSIRPLSTADKIRSWEEDAINKVRQNPVSRALGMASDAANTYQNIFGNPLENVNPAHGIQNAVGVMSGAQRAAGRVKNIEKVLDDAYLLKKGNYITSPSSIQHNVMHGLDYGMRELSSSHPRLLSELEGVRYTLPEHGSQPANYTKWTDFGVHKQETREANRLREILDPTQEAETFGKVGINPVKWDEVVADNPNIKHLTDDWAFGEGRRVAKHEVTHHAQNMVSNTPDRLKYSIDYMRQKYGPEFAQWMDADEIGARATDLYGKNKEMFGKSYFNSVLQEIDNTIREHLSDPKWKDKLSEWANEIVPVMSKRYGRDIIPISTNGQITGVLRGRARPSRILHGTPISEDVANRVKDLNPNNFGEMGLRYYTEPKTTKDAHLDEMMDFVKSGRKAINTVPESQSANFIGDITNGSVRAVPLGNIDPTLIGHDDVLRNVGRGRFRFSDGVVHWTEPPSAAEYFAVEDYLARVGKKAQRHVDAFSKKPIRLPPPTLDEW